MRNPIDILDRGEELRIAGFGDSLTCGWMVRRGFFDRFCDALERRYLGATVIRLNAGVPGDTADGGLARLPGLLERRPHLLLVQFGINDLFCGASAAAFAADLARIVDETRRAGAEPWLVVSCPLALPGDALAARPFYDAIRALGSERDVPVADLDRHWRARHDPATPAGALFLDDGVHPDDAGHALMAEGLLALWERMGGGST
ncbi:MAG TPA: SGNH/GDSL hydrolase family protein [Polyangia bacterium]|nr:SGNH/GDSL hydrolase family protein [Polyangia bacterium]